MRPRTLADSRAGFIDIVTEDNAMPMGTITKKPEMDLRPTAASFTAPSPVPARAPRALAVFAPLASGVLLWLCYFPVACGWLAWVALVPLLSLIRTTRPRVFLWTLMAGLVLFVPALQWMRVGDPTMYFAWLFVS